MLIAEDLLLLLTDDATGRLVSSGTYVDYALGGANLVELALAGRVDLTTDEDDGKAGRLVVRDASDPEDAVLAGSLAILAGKQGSKPSAVVSRLGKGLREELFDRLVHRGLLRAERNKILGIIPLRSWPAEDAQHEARVRELLVGALVQGVTPEPRTAALVSLLHALKVVHKVVDPKKHGIRRRDLDRRAMEIAEGDWASEAVSRAVAEMMAAVMAATTAATVASTAGSS